MKKGLGGAETRKRSQLRRRVLWGLGDTVDLDREGSQEGEEKVAWIF